MEQGTARQTHASTQDDAIPSREHEFAVDREDPYDLLTTRLYQARGLSVLIYGCGMEAVDNLRDDLKDGVLWALHSLIDDAYIAAHRMPESRMLKPRKCN